jgi:hypothetical protein
MDNHSVDSDELEIYYSEAAEREEEISNQIYSEADFNEKYGETQEEKDRDDEDEEILKDEENLEFENETFEPLPKSKITSPDGFQELLPTKEDHIPVKPRALSPVRKVDIHQVELPSLEGLEKVNYDSLLHREVGESIEMFEMRVKLAEIFSNVSIPRGLKFVSLDVKTVMLFSRMMTNKLWLGMEYNQEQEKLLESVIEYIPELKNL